MFDVVTLTVILRIYKRIRKNYIFLFDRLHNKFIIQKSQDRFQFIQFQFTFCIQFTEIVWAASKHLLGDSCRVPCSSPPPPSLDPGTRWPRAELCEVASRPFPPSARNTGPSNRRQ